MEETTRILLVEDNRGDARLLVETLREEDGLGFQIETCGTLKEAAEAVRNSAPDLVLLDLNLPDSQGIQTLLRLRQLVQDIPIVVLTGLDDDELGVQAVQEGAEDFLIKGDFASRALQRALRYAIERHDLKEKLEWLANHDPLTGVYNRRHFTRMIETELARSTRYKHPIGLLMVDINGFKGINDRLGHEAGDAVLKAVAEFLVGELRTIDIVIRYGGDEFLLILPETGEAITDVARRIRANAPKALQQVVPFMDSPVTLAIGASFWDCTRGIPIEDVLAEADRRM